MPTYQYACTECGHGFEQFQSFSDDALTTCPECEGRLRKVFNAVGVVFKGSGFYRNDSRKDGGSEEKPAAASGDSGSEKTGAEKTGSGGEKTGSDKPSEKTGTETKSTPEKKPAAATTATKDSSSAA